MRRVHLCFLVCAILSASVCGQEKQPTTIEAQPLLHMREGRVQGCGVRLTGGAPSIPASSWFDVSFNLFRRGVGVAQSIAYELRRSDYTGEARPARVPVQSTWLRAAQGSVRRGENVDRRETLVYTMVTDDVLALFEAVASGQPLTLGIKRWDQRTDAVYTGTPQLTDDSRHQIGDCLAALARE